MKKLSLLVILTTAFISQLTGCGGSRNAARLTGGPQGGFGSALPPAFITGPAAVLLTNSTGFSAHVEVQTTSFSNQVHTITGTLLGQGSHLLFAPPKSDRSFIWDVAENGGVVLSDALQGYGPITSGLRVTNLAPNADNPARLSERANGHPCHRTDVVVTSSDGSVADFRVWRADDLNGLPVRIMSVNGTAHFTVNLSDIRPQTLSAQLFQPPEGFTKYDSAEALMTELMARQAGTQKGKWLGNPSDSPGSSSAGQRHY